MGAGYRAEQRQESHTLKVSWPGTMSDFVSAGLYTYTAGKLQEGVVLNLQQSYKVENMRLSIIFPVVSKGSYCYNFPQWLCSWEALPSSLLLFHAQELLRQQQVEESGIFYLPHYLSSSASSYCFRTAKWEPRITEQRSQVKDSWIALSILQHFSFGCAQRKAPIDYCWVGFSLSWENPKIKFTKTRWEKSSSAGRRSAQVIYINGSLLLAAWRLMPGAHLPRLPGALQVNLYTMLARLAGLMI